MTANPTTPSPPSPSTANTTPPTPGQPINAAAALQHLSGRRIRVIQQFSHRDQPWTQIVEGKLVRFERQKTGSWYAHAVDHRLWLDRLVLEKDNGEIAVLNLDRYSRLELLPD